jgi:transcriptional regulator with XRE-family HTH domain
MNERERTNNVRALREALGWTQQELADAAGLSQPHLHNIETGRDRGSSSARRAIAAALDTNPMIVFPPALLGRAGR